MKIETIQRDKNEPCSFCGDPWSHHHQGCAKCFAIPSTHGHYCDEPLCCCIEFQSAEELSEEDIAALMGETA
jgi:hypothetical protein